MRYVYALIFLIGSFTLSSFTYAESNEANMFLPDLVFDSIVMESERCGTIVLEGWSLWEGGVCLGFSYTYTSDKCRTITVDGVQPPNGLIDSDRKVVPTYFKEGEEQQARH